MSEGEPKHTPGPWETAKVNEHGIAIVAPSGGSIGCAWPEDLLGNKHDAVANGCLIAAAPDMLAALKAVLARPEAQKQLHYLHQGIGTATPNKAWLEAEAAITKAEGRTP